MSVNTESKDDDRELPGINWISFSRAQKAGSGDSCITPTHHPSDTAPGGLLCGSREGTVGQGHLQDVGRRGPRTQMRLVPWMRDSGSLLLVLE